MRRKTLPSADSAITVATSTPVLRATELQQRRASRSTGQTANNLWGRGTKPYTCPELLPVPSITPGRAKAYTLPSRMGNHLHYPDGRVEKIEP